MFVFLILLVATCALHVHSVPVPSIQWTDSASDISQSFQWTDSASDINPQDLDRARDLMEAYDFDPKPFDTSNWQPTEENWLKPYIDINDNFRVGVTGSLEPSIGIWGQYSFQ